MKEVVVIYFFCSEITQNVSVLFFPLRDRQSDEETCLDGSGKVW